MESWFAATVEEIRGARRWVADRMADAGCDADAIDSAALVTSELTANVVRHTRSDRIGVRVSFDGNTVHIEVIDCDPNAGTPKVSAQDHSADRGRGLRIVEGLARRWGFEDRGDQRAVWADVACTS